VAFYTMLESAMDDDSHLPRCPTCGAVMEEDMDQAVGAMQSELLALLDELDHFTRDIRGAE
jgi:hypothetical protein